MVVSCWVQGCFNTAGDSVKRSFHYIPKIREHEGLQTKELSTERRRVWLANINRKAHPTPSTRICSAHFISGKPADLYDKSNPDWAPTLQLSDLLTPTKSCKKAKQASTGMKRYKRVQEREKNRIKHQVARTLIELSSTNEPEFVATPLTADVLDQDPEPICQLTFDELNNDDDTSVDELGQVTQSQVNSELQRLLIKTML
ncbi:uncharacterized protein LOC132735330 [Ruditapes philippinarum]|uniref:uncharacterized protein LOC132735330 n=1 Tax=Ruditapes philippinarum TaxID=129788 RepID=UPI00295A9CB7|nr:uncharacterized protein LOC132735330 [Ruditapes philippinarum]